MANIPCAKCGKPIDEKAVVCSNCGALPENLVAPRLHSERDAILASSETLTEKCEKLTALLWDSVLRTKDGVPTPDAGQEQIDNFWLNTARELKRAGLHAATTEFLVQCWNAFSRVQFLLGKRIYRAVFAHWIAQNYYDDRNDLGAAARWFVLAHLADLLVGHKKGHAGIVLRTVFGASKLAFDALELCSTEMANETAADWKKPHAFPEWGLTRFISSAPSARQVLGRNAGVAVHPTCPAFVAALFYHLREVKKVGNKKADTTAGALFEDLAAYLFGTIPTCITKRNIITDSEAFENDLVISNIVPQPTAITERLGRQFIVECKHWSTNIGSPVAGYFLYRMHLTHVDVGVLFIRKDITGATDEDSDSKFARDLIDRAFHEDGLSCAWITESDVEHLGDDESGLSLLDILLARLDDVQFGRPRKTK